MKHLLLLLLLLLGCVSVVAQTVPVGISYQGRLTDASNVPSPDGTGYELEVRLWTVATGGTTPIWAARYAGIPVKSGSFNLILGSPGGVAIGGAISDLKTVFATAPITYLGITVTKSSNGASIANPTEILPRQQLLSTPYAFRAELAASVDANSILSASIKDGDIKSQDLATASVTLNNLDTGSVDSSKVVDLSLTSADIAVGAIAMNRLAAEYAVFTDEKPVNTNGGSAATGWQTRALTATAALAGPSISRSGNVVTLQPGTYFVDASVPSYGSGNHQAVLRKIADDSTVIRGTSESSDTAGNNAASRSLIKGYVTITVATSFDIYHYTRSGNSDTGLGTGTQYSGVPRTEPSVFTTVHIFRIK